MVVATAGKLRRVGLEKWLWLLTIDRDDRWPLASMGIFDLV
jgi:hypothetical protein